MRTGNDDDGSSFNNTLVLSFVGQTRCALIRIGGILAGLAKRIRQMSIDY